MKKIFKLFGKWMIAGMGLVTGVILVYAATTVINSVTNQTINKGDQIGSGWFQEVNDKLNILSSNINISGGNVGIGTSNLKNKLELNGDFKIKGHIKKPNIVAFSAWQQDMNSPIQGTVTYNKSFINNGEYLNLSTGKFTAPYSGYYFFSFNGFKQNSGYSPTSIEFVINGISQGPRAYNTHLEYTNMSFSSIFKLEKGDIVSVRVEKGGLHGNHGTVFNGYLIGKL